MNRFAWTAVIATLTGCATVPLPASLSAARAAHAQLMQEPPDVQNPAEVEAARLDLQRAEDEAKRDARSWQAADTSYVALRHVETVLVNNRRRQADRHRAEVEKQLSSGGPMIAMPPQPPAPATSGPTVITVPGSGDGANVAALTMQVAQMQRDIEAERRANQERESKRVAVEAQAQRDAALEAQRKKSEEEAAARAENLKAQEAQLAELKRQLQVERDARQQAEALGQLAKVRQEERGLVVSLSGSVLFASGKSVLLPSAKRTLAQIAEALKQGQPRPITIEGHTDSRGSDEINERLSQSRADAVRAYLLEQGVPAGRMVSRGMGESSPVADNTSAEGRAVNRRVELVLASAPAASASSAAGGSGPASPPDPSPSPVKPSAPIR